MTIKEFQIKFNKTYSLMNVVYRANPNCSCEYFVWIFDKESGQMLVQFTTLKEMNDIYNLTHGINRTVKEQIRLLDKIKDTLNW